MRRKLAVGQAESLKAVKPRVPLLRRANYIKSQRPRERGLKLLALLRRGEHPAFRVGVLIREEGDDKVRHSLGERSRVDAAKVESDKGPKLNEMRPLV